MAYSIIDQYTKDLDIFFKDGHKLIHIASAGGRIPDRLAENDEQNDHFASHVSNLGQTFEFEINQNLAESLKVLTAGLDRYFNSYIQMARRGFHSHDKTRPGNFEDPFFHLVARPKKTEEFSFAAGTEDLMVIDTELPTEFTTFNLFELLENK